MNKMLLAGILLLAGVAAADDERQLITMEPKASDKLVYNYGPNQGRSVVTSLLRNAAGEVVGECHTLFYGFTTSRERVEGFSCTTKK